MSKNLSSGKSDWNRWERPEKQQIRDSRKKKKKKLHFLWLFKPSVGETVILSHGDYIVTLFG